MQLGDRAQHESNDCAGYERNQRSFTNATGMMIYRCT